MAIFAWILSLLASPAQKSLIRLIQVSNRTNSGQICHISTKIARQIIPNTKTNPIYCNLIRPTNNIIKQVANNIMAEERSAGAISIVITRIGKSNGTRSEEHTSELQSRGHLVCRLLLEKKNSTPPLSRSQH